VWGKGGLAGSRQSDGGQRLVLLRGGSDLEFKRLEQVSCNFRQSQETKTKGGEGILAALKARESENPIAGQQEEEKDK